MRSMIVFPATTASWHVDRRRRSAKAKGHYFKGKAQKVVRSAPGGPSHSTAAVTAPGGRTNGTSAHRREAPRIS